MKSVLLIGMGQFGQLLGEKLIGMGNEVMIVDKEEDIINTIAAKYTGALICNCMVEDNLKTLDVPSYDACVVTIADDFQSSLEITSILKDLGSKIHRFKSKHRHSTQISFARRRGRDYLSQPRYSGKTCG